ncbi:MAG: hypothetical protein MRY59_00095 [Aquisalinus sp.]|nr:hypothetical protein [Aquisalinus sp.]
MSDKPTEGRIRIELAQFMYARNIDLQDLYRAMGADPAQCSEGALSHMAGIIDGIELASARIRKHGVDDWAKS